MSGGSVQASIHGRGRGQIRRWRGAVCRAASDQSSGNVVDTIGLSSQRRVRRVAEVWGSTSRQKAALDKITGVAHRDKMMVQPSRLRLAVPCVTISGDGEEMVAGGQQ